MESKRVEVENCWQCPFADVDPYGVCRRSEDVPYLEDDASTATPDWCPLRTGDVLVTLRKGGE